MKTFLSALVITAGILLPTAASARNLSNTPAMSQCFGSKMNAKAFKKFQRIYCPAGVR